MSGGETEKIARLAELVSSEIFSFFFAAPLALLTLINLMRLTTRRDLPAGEFERLAFVAVLTGLFALAFWGAANWAALLGLAGLAIALILRPLFERKP